MPHIGLPEDVELGNGRGDFGWGGSEDTEEPTQEEIEEELKRLEEELNPPAV